MASSRADGNVSKLGAGTAAAGSDVLQLHVFADTHVRLSTSLAVHAYLRAAGLPFELVHARYPVYASVGDLPCIMHKSVAVGATSCLDYLKRVVDIDDWLDDAGRSDLVAFTCLVTTSLFHAEMHAATHASVAVEGLPRAAQRSHARAHSLSRDMASSMPVPLRWFVPTEVLRRVAVSNACAGVVDDAACSAVMHRAYTSLASKLQASTGPFLLGQRLSSLDCVLFGHLAAVRSGEMGAWIRAHPHTHVLIHHFKAVAARLFGGDGVILPPLHEHALVVRCWGVNEWEGRERQVLARHVQRPALAQARAVAPTEGSTGDAAAAPSQQQQTGVDTAGFGVAEEAKHASATAANSSDSLMRAAVTLGIGALALLLLREAAARKWV